MKSLKIKTIKDTGDKKESTSFYIHDPRVIIGHECCDYETKFGMAIYLDKRIFPDIHSSPKIPSSSTLYCEFSTKEDRDQFENELVNFSMITRRLRIPFSDQNVNQFEEFGMI